MSRSQRILLIGYGNPGRLDDGLGQLLADAIAEEEIEGVTVITEYQLQLEHASDIAEHDAVIFADAAVCGADPFEFFSLEPAPGAAFSTHSVSPEALLALAEEHFGEVIPGYALAIRGHEFNEYDERLSEQAQANLEAAFEFMRERLEDGDLDDHVTATGRVEVSGQFA